MQNMIHCSSLKCYIYINLTTIGSLHRSFSNIESVSLLLAYSLLDFVNILKYIFLPGSTK